MKNGKRLSVAERKYLASLKVEAQNWLICKKTSEQWTSVHKYCGQIKTVLAP